MDAKRDLEKGLFLFLRTIKKLQFDYNFKQTVDFSFHISIMGTRIYLIYNI